MNSLFRAVFLLMFFIVVGNAGDLQVYVSDNKDGKITPQSIEESFRKAGFYISDNRDMNIPFNKKFGNSDFSIYNLFTTIHYESVYKLSKDFPDIALFAPMSMSIYTKKGDTKIHVSMLTPQGLSKITSVPQDNKELQNIFATITKALKDAMPKGKYEDVKYTTTKSNKELVTRYNIKMSNADFENEKSNFQMEFEGMLEQNDFVVAGFNNLNGKFKEYGESNYDIYEAYSICKLPVIYEIAKTRPEAGAFAPCSMYNAKVKGKDGLKVAFPNVYNWIETLDIKDEKAKATLLDAQQKIDTIFDGIKE